MIRYFFPVLVLVCEIPSAQNFINPLSIIELDRSIHNSLEVLDQVPELRAQPIVRPFECRIFPMKVESNLQVVLPMSENFTFRLVDSEGKVLFSHYQIFGENQVNLSHLKADKYFVEISSEKGKIIEKITKT